MKKFSRRKRTPFRRRRLFKKKRMIGKKKRFNTMLNSVAEKKVFMKAQENVAIYSMLKDTQSINADFYNFTKLTPSPGTAYNETVGSRIFVRYIRLEIAISAVANNYHLGDVYLVLAKVRPNQGMPASTIRDFFSNSGQPFVDPRYFKEELVWVKFKKFCSVEREAPVASNVQGHHIFKKKFKIMENYIKDKETAIFYPATGSMYWGLCYPSSTLVIGTGSVAIASQVYTYTDV